MRNTTEFTRGYQIWYMLRREFIGVCICAFVQFLLFISSYSNDIFRNISGVLFSVVHFWIIYDSAAALGKLDRKTYTPLGFEIKWAVLWGILISLMGLVFIGIYKFNWHFGNPVSVFINIVFFILESPYYAFLISSPKTVPFFVIIISVVIPVVASVTGYISSKNSSFISNKLRGLMFEKDNNDT